MELFSLPVGLYASNCHLVWDEATLQAFVIDAGGDAQDIIDAVERRHLVPMAVLLTHAHVDHIGAVPEVCAHFGIGVWCHGDERPLYLSPDNEILPWLPRVEGLPAPLEALPAADGPLAFQAIHTPGHTRGGVCYHFPEGKMLFSGDTLFAGSVGRTDFPGGNSATLLASIRERLLVLPEDTTVYPGHGESTTIAIEKRSNPFLA